MKKIAFITILLSLLGAAAFAQDGKTIYNKYSDKKNVSAVYISPAMFKLIGRLPDIDMPEEDVNLSPIVKELTGMYLISSENPKTNKSLAEDADKMVKDGRYELLMEAREDGEEFRIYVISSGDTITSFVMIATEDDECTFISIDGKLLKKDLERLLASAMKDD